MKIRIHQFALILLMLCFGRVQAQAPEGTVPGSIKTVNGTIQNGYIKENIRKKGNIAFYENAGTKKKVYDATELESCSIDTVQYKCISGDFFRIICTGKMDFLQKASNASGKLSYNGTEPIISSGTPGKAGDYFIYTGQQLVQVEKNSIPGIVSKQLSNCAAAVEKAKSIGNDIAAFSSVVTIYNEYTK
jgi:hypothetical protein